MNRLAWQSRAIGYHWSFASGLCEITAAQVLSLASKHNNGKRERSMRNRNRPQRGGSLMPPQLKTVIPFSRSVRLLASAAVVEGTPAITVNDLLRLQSMAVTTTLAYPIAYAVRIRRFRMWFTAPAASAVAVTASVEWNAGATGFLLDGVSVSATTMSSTEVCLLDTRPPTESVGSWYQAGVTGGTNEILSFTCPDDTLIQVDYDWVPNFTEPALGSFSITGGTVGTVFGKSWSPALVPVSPLNSYS